MSGSRRLRAALACLLLLLQALLPGLHRWQHAVAETAAHAGLACSCGERHGEPGGRTGRRDHDHVDHACAVCALLAQARWVLPSGGGGAVVGAAPQWGAVVAFGGAAPRCVPMPGAWARGPPRC